MENLELNIAIEKFKATSVDTDNRRSSWTNRIRDLIELTFTEINDQYKLQCIIRTNDSLKNFQGVGMYFRQWHSGIVLDTKEGIKAYVKRGGSLHFVQLFNGNVVVKMNYPEIEEITPKGGQEIIGTSSPELITRDYIEACVILFLNKITEWEEAAI